MSSRTTQVKYSLHWYFIPPVHPHCNKHTELARFPQLSPLHCYQLLPVISLVLILNFCCISKHLQQYAQALSIFPKYIDEQEL